jgi:hypothetical protein
VSSRGLRRLSWVEARDGRVRRANRCREEDSGELSPLMADDGDAWAKSGAGPSRPVVGSGQEVEGAE